MSIKQRFFIGGLIVFALSFFLRAISLHSVGQVVFDEVHFGKFISSYCCTHQHFFDIHPPIGKLIIAGGAYLSGYSGEFSFEFIGQIYGDVPIQNIRMTTAFIGALLPVVIFILLLQVGVSFPFSLLGAGAVALDNALVVESRFILTDSILLTATFGAIACAFASIRAKKEYLGWVFVIFAGIVSGIAVGTKFTGLTGGFLVCALFAYHAYREGARKWRYWTYKAALMILFGCLTYLIGWMLHFSLLTMPGTGDAWGVPTGNFWTDLVTTHKQMVSANYNLTADHPYGSKWYTWPFMVRSVFYWQGESNRFIYLLGNPVVWWGSFLLLFTGVISQCMRGGKQLFSSGAWIFMFGYFVAYIPLMRVPRVLFLYHYLTPLLFSLLFGVWYLDTVIPKNKKAVAGVISVCVLIGFYAISPVTYGTPLSDFWYQALFSLSHWR